MTDKPHDAPPIPNISVGSEPTEIYEGSLWPDEDRFYVYHNGQWVELTDDA